MRAPPLALDANPTTTVLASDRVLMLQGSTPINVPVIALFASLFTAGGGQTRLTMRTTYKAEYVRGYARKETDTWSMSMNVGDVLCAYGTTTDTAQTFVHLAVCYEAPYKVYPLLTILQGERPIINFLT